MRRNRTTPKKPYYGYAHGHAYVLIQFTRVILGIQVLTASVTLPPKMILKPRVYRSLLTLLGPVMLCSVLITALVAKL